MASQTPSKQPVKRAKRKASRRMSEDAGVVQTSHPISGLDPNQCYLDVVPEAKALYKVTTRSASKRKLDRHSFDAPQMSLSSLSSLESGIGMQSDEEDDDGDSSSEEEDDSEEQEEEVQGAKPRFSHPIVRWPRKRRRKYQTYRSIIHEIDELMKDFRLTDETYVDIMRLLNEEMDKGLRRDTHHTASVKMFPTYVRSLPDGTEEGRFLALDLGGTNFRVLLIELNGKDQPKVTSKIFLIPRSIMQGPGKHLFGHIANCIHEFLSLEGLLHCGKMLLGFTFSFPCYQIGLASAKLVKWTKGFRCSGVENKDVVEMLHQAIQQRGEMDIECVAVINDPVGALISGAHQHPTCRVGLILGTGTNCCYVERLDSVELWEGEGGGPQQMAVNTEWGAFGDHGGLQFVRNAFDVELDKHSLNPGCQQFEKMISGMYMGELVRLVLCELVTNSMLFGGEASDQLFTPNLFLTKYISEIESDDPQGNFDNTKLILQELDIQHFTMDDCRHVQHVCWQVSQRAAFLAATGVAAVIQRLNLPDVTVAVDGSLYRFHPHFKDLMDKKIKQLTKPEQKFQLVVSQDGSGKGAALVAAVAIREKRETLENGNNVTKSQETEVSTADRVQQEGRKEEFMEEK